MLRAGTLFDSLVCLPVLNLDLDLDLRLSRSRGLNIQKTL